MDWGTNEATRSSQTRRRFLGTLGGAAAASLAGCSDSDGGASASTATTTEGAITVGLATATSGQYIDIGEEEDRGLQMAVKHLNEGGGFVDAGVFGVLEGSGVEGKQVETVTVDTEGNADAAESAVAPLLEDGELDMLTGGIAGDVVTTLRDLSDEHDVPYFTGTCPLSTLSGEGCSPHMYREMYPSTALMNALGPTLGEEVGDNATFYQLSVEAPEGEDMAASVRSYFNRPDAPGWQGFGSTTVRPGTTDFSDEMTRINSTNPSAVFFNLIGLDAVNALNHARDGLSSDITIVIPLLTQSLVDSLGEWDGDILGTIPWHGTIEEELTDVFDTAYRNEYGGVPGSSSRAGTGVAQLVYGQTIVYAAAVERADSTDADAVRRELENSAHNLGLGREQLQSCNHQATRPVPVVRGRDDQFDLLSVEGGVVAECDEEPATDCLAF